MINPTFHNINSAVLYKIQQTYNPYWSKQSLRPMTGKIPETLTKEDTHKKKKKKKKSNLKKIRNQRMEPCILKTKSKERYEC
jgi:hypothetical protein